MPNERRPDNKDIDEARTHYVAMWRDSHAQWKLYDDYYHRKYGLWPAGVTKRPTYRPSTPTNVIDHAADTQLAFEPRVHRNPAGDGENHKTDADSVEVALKAILDDSALMEPSLIWKQAGRYMLHYGYTVIEGPMLDLRDQPEPDDLKAQRDWNPIRIRSPHPSRVLLEPMEKKPPTALRTSKMYAGQIADMSKARAGRSKRNIAFPLGELSRYTPLTVVDYWTENWHAFKVVDGQSDSTGKAIPGETLWAEENNWGFVPWSHAFAGFGMEPSDQEEFDPSFLATGLLHPILDSIKLQAQRMAAHHQMLIRNAYADLGTSRDPSEAQQQLAREGILQGEEGDWWVMPTPQVQTGLLQSGADIDADIEQGSYTKALAGQREPGITTVGQQQILSSAARLKFAAPLVQLQHLASVTASRILRLVDVLNDTYGIGSIGANGEVLKASEIHGQYNARVTFEVADPLLEIQRRQTGMQEVSAGLKSPETYMEEDARRENVTGEMRKLLRHAIRTHPGVISKLAEAQADLMGLGDEFRAAIAQEQAEIAQDTRQTEALGQTTRVSPTNNNPATSASSENGDLSTLESLGG